MQRALTEIQMAYVVGLKDSSSLTWSKIKDIFNQKFKTDYDVIFLTNQWSRHRNNFMVQDTKDGPVTMDNQIALNQEKNNRRLQKTNGITGKMNRQIMDAWNNREDILDAVRAAAKDAVKDLNVRKKIPKPKFDHKKQAMTKELLLSDLHFGKKTDVFNLEVAQKRLKEVVEVTLKEIERDSAHYNVERLIVAMLGDIIENATMHGLESLKGCEFGNSKQTYVAGKYLFEMIIRPLAETGIAIDVPCVTGNHDRDSEEKTFHNPGEEHLTYIIYNYLKDMSQLAGYTNVKFDIPKEPWCVATVYGANILFEHYDLAKSPERKTLETLLSKRTLQMKKPLHFMRGGHFHEAAAFGYYRIIVNGSLPGSDSYSSVLGFHSEASQTLNSYVKTKSRPNPFYKSLVIQLDHIK